MSAEIRSIRPSGGVPSPEREPHPAAVLDLESVARAAKGEPKAQAWLAARVLPPVRRVTRSLSTCAADSDDAAQLTLIEVLRSARTYRGLASLDAWAGRIAARVTLRMLADERRRRERTALATVPSDPAFEGASLCESIPNDLRFYLARLPAAQRHALVMRHALGYSMEEIAEMTGVSRNTIKSRLRLGAAALQKLLRRDARLAEWGNYADVD